MNENNIKEKSNQIKSENPIIFKFNKDQTEIKNDKNLKQFESNEEVYKSKFIDVYYFDPFKEKKDLPTPEYIFKKNRNDSKDSKKSVQKEVNLLIDNPMEKPVIENNMKEESKRIRENSAQKSTTPIKHNRLIYPFQNKLNQDKFIAYFMDSRRLNIFEERQKDTKKIIIMNSPRFSYLKDNSFHNKKE